MTEIHKEKVLHYLQPQEKKWLGNKSESIIEGHVNLQHV